MKTLLTTALLASAMSLTGCISVIDSGNNDGAYSNFDGVSASDKRKIEAAVYDYFDGQGEADFTRLSRAFDDGAAMFGVRENDQGEEYLRVWPDMNKVIERWGNNPNPHGERDSAILDMKVTDGRIATVHFKSADRFYDVLTLVKIDGDWKIASKVFVSQ
jgi:hypothetical protein